VYKPPGDHANEFTSSFLSFKFVCSCFAKLGTGRRGNKAWLLDTDP
jgi:hypothetical protein